MSRCASARGWSPAASSEGADGARDGHARRVRAVRARQRPGGAVDRRRRHERDPRRRATPRPSWNARASARGCRSACSRARRRPATATWRRSTRRRSPTAACSTSAAARCSSCAWRDRLAAQTGSWRVGTVRMSERFLPANGPAKRRQLEALREHVAEELAQARVAGRAPRRRAGARLVGIGGTVRNLAAAAQRAAGLPTNGVQGTMLGADALDELVERLAALPAAERAERAGHQARARRPDPRRRGGRAGGAARRAASTAWRRPRPGCARACSSSGCSAAATRPPSASRCSRTCAARAC